jgi:predicted porin
MKKSLIAVAVAGLFAAPVAMAEVTLSGAINLGIELGKSSSSGGTPSLTQVILNSNYSHVDLESVDDIGGGNKIIFHYQLNVTPQNAAFNNINDNNRNSFLGVAGGWGAFKMGTNENVYERFMYTADPLDGALGPGGNLNILGTPGAGRLFEAGQGNCAATGCPDFYRRTDHTIWYESPKFGGFDFEVDYTLSAFKNNAGTDPKVLSVGGKFAPEGAPFYVDLAYEKHDDMFGLTAFGLAPGIESKDTGMQVGAGMMFGDLGLHLRYERLKYEQGAVELKRNAYWLGVKFALPSGYIGAELGIAQDADISGVPGASSNDTGAKMFGIGYFHNLSKQSQLQFIYGRTDNEDSASYAQAGTPNGGVPGSDHQVFHVGLKHTF